MTDAPDIPDIMDEKTIRYRRNTLVVCLIIIASSLIDNVKYDDLGLFGVKLSGSGKENEAVILAVLTTLFFYQSITFFIYSRVAYRVWFDGVLMPHIQWWGYAFHNIPANLNHYTYNGKQGLCKDKVLRAENLGGSFSIYGFNENKGRYNVYENQTSLLYVFKWKLLMFWVVEIGIPITLIMWAGSNIFERFILGLITPYIKTLFS